MELQRQEQVGAIIVAAGSSTRMEGQNMLLAPLGQAPVVAHSIAALEQQPEVGAIVLVTREEDLPLYLRLVEQLACQKVRTVCKGGATRQQSVWAGVSALPEGCSYVAIHDGARPFLSREVFSRCLECARLHGAATAAVPVKDTIKQAGPDGWVAGTPDRSGLWMVQTPQIFRLGLYRQAMAHARENNLDVTDDCQLVEAIGGSVYLSMGEYRNIKITTPEDLTVARAFWEEWK